jgi:hypothetical protein
MNMDKPAFDYGDYFNEFSILGYEEDNSKPKHNKKTTKPPGKCNIRMSTWNKLLSHPCSIQHDYNPITKRMNKVITCLYDGCSKKFTKTWNILDHFKIHTGNKPFPCYGCNRLFSQKGNLTKHLKLHMNCDEYMTQLKHNS